MAQTLLALGALVALTLFAMYQSGSVLRTEQGLIRTEVTSVAAGKLVEALDRYEAEPLPPHGHVQGATVSVAGYPLVFDLTADVEGVEPDGVGWRPAPPGAPCSRLTLRATGPYGAPPSYRLPAQGGRGGVALSRVYCKSSS